MSMCHTIDGVIMDIQNKIDIVRKNGHEVWVSGGVSLDAIETLEDKMGIQLPILLKEFLLEFGALGIYDCFLSGISELDPLSLSGGNIYADTCFLREDYPNLGENLWVLQLNEDGAYCLDTAEKSSNGEFAIVSFESGNSKVVYNSFPEFLTGYFKPWIES
ncbi:SMI1/KNR4 family protein [Pleionea litopenaei]|uniref:SMI1/KNR4 family protein n=1 Tax=Pleionea litopenaei TaxID=3070815 RepID=A0AA51RX12_9GAMM|nr:SMI1/KNR4 family protein [Pleionea sp. HL-JVS1]WMS89024.1 SMI1/KNR4 family protein [Pleionea sp. HL-JVS1]